MALKTELCFVWRHALAVIFNADVRFAAVTEFDLNTRGAGIDTVFNQFLDHCDWALNDLASGDLVGDSVG